MKLLIINADDFGLSDGICRGIVELLDIGAITSTTMMVAADGAIERVSKWDIKKQTGKVGVHLQLSSGKPMIRIDRIPSLVSHQDGRFLRKDQFPGMDTSEIELEWRAQIECAHDLLGHKPSHLDSHHGAHHIDRIGEVFCRLSLEYKLPIRDLNAVSKYSANRKLLGSEHVIYDWTARGLNIENLIQMIDDSFTVSKSGRIVEIVTHPGYSDDHLRDISSLNDLRENELVSLRNLCDSGWLEDANVKLVNFSSFK